MTWFQDRYTSMKNTTMIAYIVIGWLSFIPAIYLINILDLFEITNAVCMAAALGFCIGYARAFWNAIKLPVHTMTTAHLFITGAFIVHFSAIQIFGYQFVWRIAGRPEWWINSNPVLFSRWTMSTALIVMMMTSFSQHGDLSPGVYSKVAVAISSIVLVVAIFLTFVTN